MHAARRGGCHRGVTPVTRAALLIRLIKKKKKERSIEEREME